MGVKQAEHCINDLCARCQSSLFITVEMDAFSKLNFCHLCRKRLANEFRKSVYFGSTSLCLSKKKMRILLEFAISSKPTWIPDTYAIDNIQKWGDLEQIDNIPVITKTVLDLAIEKGLIFDQTDSGEYQKGNFKECSEVAGFEKTIVDFLKSVRPENELRSTNAGFWSSTMWFYSPLGGGKTPLHIDRAKAHNIAIGLGLVNSNNVMFD